MGNEQFQQYIQTFHQQITVLQSYANKLLPQQQQQVFAVLEEIATVLGNLQLIYEEMQTSLEASAVVESGLFEQNQYAIAAHQHYYNLFQSSPDAYLVINPTGLILEANAAIALMLNVPQNFLIGKPFAVFLAQRDRPTFRTFLNQLSAISNAPTWEINLCPRNREPFVAKLKIAIIHDDADAIKTLLLGIHALNEYKQLALQPAPNDDQTSITHFRTTVPQPFDGLQVLVVEDEADTREFIRAILESHGIRVTAVASAAAALEALEQFHPDVLVSDIRMPDQDGYSLIRQVREIEAKKGWRIPAAALTAYLVEDREKALAAGFESHLHKLAQPAELVEMVTRLAAGRASHAQK